MSETRSKVTPLRSKRTCPECKRESSRTFFPFCSERCKDIDLGRWLQGSYVIPGRSISSDEDDPDR